MYGKYGRWAAGICTIGILFAISAARVEAQFTKEEKAEIAITLAAKINRAIGKYQQGNEFREKVVSRIFQCQVMYGILSNTQQNTEAKTRAKDASDISGMVLAGVSDGISANRYKQILMSAERFLAELHARKDKRELFNFLRNCRSFNEPEQIDEAVQELTL